MAEPTKTEKPSTKLEANPCDDPNHPMYLHHSDQSGAILVPQPLNEENYGTWSRAMTMALSAKNKEGFIDGSISRPKKSSTSELQQWNHCNNLIKSWLIYSISKDIRASVIYNEVAAEIWNDLKDCYSHANSIHLFHIEQVIHDCTQSSMTISAYYTKLKALWDERDALCTIPIFECGTMMEVMQYSENQKTMKFLMGLDTSYATARGQILLMDHLPSVNKAHSLILQDEKQRSVSSTTTATPDTVGFAVRDSSRNSRRGSTPRNPHLKCDRCDMVGHTSDTCRSHLKCDFCGWKGHAIDACRKLKKARRRAMHKIGVHPRHIMSRPRKHHPHNLVSST